MSKAEMFEKIRSLKDILKSDGFIIDGVFGSYARDDFNSDSDVDILYHLEKPFLDKYRGFAGLSRLSEIKEFLAKEIQKDVDIAPKDGLSNTGKKYILSEVIYV